MPPHCAAACQKARPLNGVPGAVTDAVALVAGRRRGRCRLPASSGAARPRAGTRAARPRWPGRDERRDCRASCPDNKAQRRGRAKGAAQREHQPVDRERAGLQRRAEALRSAIAGAAIAAVCAGAGLTRLRRAAQRDRLRFAPTRAPWLAGLGELVLLRRRRGRDGRAGAASRHAAAAVARRAAGTIAAASKSSATRCGLRSASKEFCAIGCGSMKPRKRRASSDSAQRP